MSFWCPGLFLFLWFNGTMKRNSHLVSQTSTVSMPAKATVNVNESRFNYQSNFTYHLIGDMVIAYIIYKNRNKLYKWFKTDFITSLHLTQHEFHNQLHSSLFPVRATEFLITTFTKVNNAHCFGENTVCTTCKIIQDILDAIILDHL